ncbi:MAG: 5'-nucleotidase C-terminal domain-containing protein [Paracoccaceae bacterium]|nr:5'-nucleotidase C-terminal domain-containing protein [Paracoccaceae bacterium]
MKPSRLFALLGGAAVAAAAIAAPAVAAPETVTIIHFNDLDRMGEKRGRGGVARLASVINAERAKGGHVLVTFGGDTISPSLMSGLDEGAHMIDLLNGLGLTAMVLGNHEFDFGPDVAMQRIAEAEFPILGANHRCADGEIVDGAEPSMMVDVGDFSIGILGLTTVGTEVKSSPGDCRFQDAAETAASVATGLRDAGADLVVALAHTDVAEDAELLAARSVDVLLSGDDHMLRTEYTGKILFAESGEQAEWVTLIDLKLDEVAKDDSTEFVWSAEYRVVDTVGVEPDATVAAAVQAYEDKLSEELNVELGTTTTELDSRRETVRSREAAIANLFADAIREATGADISMVNGGGIRANRIYEPGTVLTRRDIQSELPFGNKTVVLEVSGQDIIEMLENGLSQIEKGAGRFPHVSGISVTYDPGAEPGSRVVAVTRNGEPIDPSAMLKFAVNDYVAGGGDGYAMLKDRKRIVDEYSAILMTVQVFNYIASRGEIAPMLEGRLKLVN